MGATLSLHAGTAARFGRSRRNGAIFSVLFATTLNRRDARHPETADLR
jgi:hypothetical protein